MNECWSTKPKQRPSMGHVRRMLEGRNQVRHVEEFMVKDAKFVGQEDSGTALELIETIVRIVNSTFLSNRKGLFRE